MLTDISAYYPVGFIAKTTGPSGELLVRFEVTESMLGKKIRSFFILINKKPVPLLVATFNFTTENSAIIRFTDYSSKEQARDLVGYEVYLPDANMLKKPSGIKEIYLLKGYLVQNEKRKHIGIVVGFQDNKGNYLLEVKTNESTDPVLIPLHENLIKSIDSDKKIIKLIIPDGLLEL